MSRILELADAYAYAYMTFKEPDARAALAAAVAELEAQVSQPKAETPKVSFEDQRVQEVYAILCSEEVPPKGEHWEGFVARRIVDLFPQPKAKPVQEQGKLTSDQKDTERRAFEQWYVENAFDYERDPLGSKLCGDQWAAWKYRAAAPQAKPLTDDQIISKMPKADSEGWIYTQKQIIQTVRAIEAAHGIGKEQT
jgi:hypothetical protein